MALAHTLALALTHGSLVPDFLLYRKAQRKQKSAPGLQLQYWFKVASVSELEHLDVLLEDLSSCCDAAHNEEILTPWPSETPQRSTTEV